MVLKPTCPHLAPAQIPLVCARWLREGSAALVPMAVVVGAVTGLAAVAFRWLVTTFTRMFTGYDDYSALGRVASTHWPWLGFWFLLLAPVIAAAVYGPIVHRFAPEARGHGVPEVMYAVRRRGGRIAPQVTLVKALASALCIGGGGSVGREGPIVQIGSAAGSTLAQLLRLNTSRVRLLVACGAAGGISATFNTPLAGPFFAMELILRDFAAESFGAVVLSSVTASVVGRALLGDEPFLELPTFAVHSPVEYSLYIALGVVVGIVGVLFSKLLYLVEDVCDWAWRGPEWARPAVGGVFLGGILIAVPQLYGVGYPVLQDAVGGRYLLGMLLLLMVGKMFATSLTIGIGGSGGVFAPTLFIGAMAGTAFGTLVHEAFPSTTEAAGAYGLIGMGAALGGATRAPITAVIILFELTGQYSIILPLMVAVAIAAGTGRLLSKETIYTAKLWRRGVDLDAPPAVPATVHDLIGPAPDPLPENTSLKAAVDRFAAEPGDMLPVVTADGAYRGCVSARDVTAALGRSNPPESITDLVWHPPSINIADTTAPVTTSGGTNLIGWITGESVTGRRHSETRGRA